MERDHPQHRHHPPDPKRNGDPRHEQDLDTVAQKPTSIGLGTPVTEPHADAHHDPESPLPGAQPPMENEAVLREPEHVAARLKAIVEGAKVAFRQMGPLRGWGAWV